MLPSSFDSEGRQWAWDSTSLKDAETCLRLYYYRHIEGWQPMQTSVHLLFGGWYATALEHYHKHLALGDSDDVAVRKVVREALELTWEREWEDVTEDNDLHPAEGGIVGDELWKADGDCILRTQIGKGHPWQSDHNFKTRENLIRTIIWYIDQFGVDDPLEVVHLANGDPAVEHSFTFELTDNLVYCGHIDRLVEYQGDIFVQDQKTTGSTVTPRYFEQFQHPETQMTGYTFAGKVISQRPIKGVIIDAAQIAVGFSRFERGFTFRTPAQLEEWHQTSLYHIGLARLATEHMLGHDGGAEAFPMNPVSCDKYGGCPFRNVCSKSPEVRSQFLKAEFVKGPRWNPLERR